ncbi:hypothetical protein Celaphus_00004023 [Cervus elaphus hippelaphus]|uniref:Uncharacterized protein n=1 Tax=Cervus elaphus hippelaphus TaxID=46360 RepID=A0A212DE39_CEREH|nr:hypothetical protein Celaphus_00004023 [Cervus elaphus hippelaphus]
MVGITFTATFAAMKLAGTHPERVMTGRCLPQSCTLGCRATQGAWHPSHLGAPHTPSHLRMCPVPSTFHREPVCCECLAKFGGYLPVPRAKAALPYWIQKMIRSYIPKTTKACLCPCHRFGGHLPMPRDQAVMPYWVPQVLRSHKKVVKRQQSFKGISEAPLDVRSGYNRWRICGEGRHLLKWQQLQALHQAGPVASGQPEGPPAPLLPLNLSLLTLLHALLRVMEAIRVPFLWMLLLFPRPVSLLCPGWKPLEGSVVFLKV